MVTYTIQLFDWFAPVFVTLTLAQNPVSHDDVTVRVAVPDWVIAEALSAMGSA